MDGFLINLIYLVLIFLAIFIPSYYRLRIQPIRLVENDFDFIDRQLNAMNEQQRIAQPNKINVKPVEIPFSVEFNLLKSTSTDGIYFKIKKYSNDLNKLNLIILWSVDIDKFYSKIEKTIDETYAGDIENSFKDSCQRLFHKKIEHYESDEEFYYSIPVDCNDSFKQIETNQTLRNVYHTAVILYRKIDNLPNDAIVANISIFHLKDKKMETRLLHNYLKCLNNKIISLTVIFFKSYRSLILGTGSKMNIKIQDDDLCVACQSNRSDQVLLPCTHKCLCSECLLRVPNNKCPMCRIQITNKFEIRN